MKTIAAGLLLFVATVAACDFGDFETHRPMPDSWDSHREGRLGASLGKGLRAWWPLDANAIDASGRGHDGLIHGAEPTANRFGRTSRAMRFDGVDDWIDFGASPLLKPAFPVTITMWVRTDKAGGSAPFANSYDPPENTGIWIAFSSDRNRPAIGVGYGGPAGGSSRLAAVGGSPILLGEWVHLAAVLRSTADVSIWLNGVEEIVDLDRAGRPMQYGPGPIVAGVRKSGLTLPLLYFAGALDELRLYDRELTALEIGVLSARVNVRER